MKPPEPPVPPRIDHAAIRRERLRTLLPRLMEEQQVEAWLTFTRENVPDPLLPVFGIGHIVARAAFLFTRTDGRFRATALAASYDVDPIARTGLFDEVLPYKEEGAKPHLRRLIAEGGLTRVAVNVSRDVTIADGLTSGMRRYLEETLGPEIARGFTSSERLVVSLLGRKLPAEIAALETAVLATQRICAEALTRERVVPGTTTERALADFMAARARELGCAMAFESVVVGPARGHSEPTDRVIREGDVIRLDWGASYEGYCADIQRTAWVAKAGQPAVPAWLARLFAATLKANRAALAALRPGNTGLDVDRAGRSSLVADGYAEYPHGSGHAIGLKVHDVGPLLGPDWKERYGDQVRFRIEPDQVFAVEPLLYIRPPELDYDFHVGLEEDAVVGPDGARVIGAPQTEVILIA
ncbi:MAG TPA: M24 family metallopeptidase [Candidatus Polarisedimenticolia bacterium]|nr:M24 family metallopeptidase [Candidatus Polarisedimenticolia bacterium]